VIRSSRVVTPDGIMPAAIHVLGTIITGVGAWDEVPEHTAVVEAGDLMIMPGIVDTHVHCNEPGRTDWEGFETATAAAAAGGVTTILDMPLNSIPATTSRYGLEEKRRASDGKCHVHLGFIGGVVPGNVDELARMADGGVRAFKCFLVPSGVDEFPAMREADLRKAFPVLADLGLPLMVHAEHPALLRPEPRGGSPIYDTYLASRPPEAESAAIEWIVKMMADFPVPVHIVHLSSPSSLSAVRHARNRGLPITVETCPHYLTFAAEEIGDGATDHKCAPPIRDREAREGLWDALMASEIDLIASDHSPCPPEMKQTDGDFFTAWGGIASLQLSLPAVWTGAQARGIGVEMISHWMSDCPAHLAGYDAHKGRIAPGFDADLVVWDPEASFVVDPAHLFHRHKITPYAGRELLGVVHQTYVCGRLAYDSAGHE
jgi:allantoinase